jgi:hypothetical protein
VSTQPLTPSLSPCSETSVRTVMNHYTRQPTRTPEGTFRIGTLFGSIGSVIRVLILLHLVDGTPAISPALAMERAGVTSPSGRSSGLSKIVDAKGASVPGRFGHALDAERGGFLAPADLRFGHPPLTVEFWAQLSEGEGDRVFLANGVRDSRLYWELVAGGDGRLLLGLGGFDPAAIVSDRSLQIGQWHHVAMILETNRVRLFVDAEPAGTTFLTRREGPSPIGALGIGTRLEERRPSAVLLDDLRISAGVRDILAPPRQPLVKDRTTIGLWTFEESEEDYLARWTPGGETNQRDLPYPHRVGEYEFKSDPDWVDDRWQRTDKGPFLTHTTQIPGYEVGVKTAVVFLGDDQNAAVLFDLERCAPTVGLTAAQLEIDPARFGLLRKPVLSGRMQFHLPPDKAWRRGGVDAVVGAPLDRNEVRYRGLHLQGPRVLFGSEVLGGTVLDTSWVKSLDGVTAIRRSIQLDGIQEQTVLTLAELPAQPMLLRQEGLRMVWCSLDGTRTAIALMGAPEVDLLVQGRDVLLGLPGNLATSIHWLVWSGPEIEWDTFSEMARAETPLESPASLQRPGPRRWGEPLITRGSLATDTEAPYVMDTITVPYENPHRALFFIGGLDFFPNGDAALCTAHGDVWVVRGLDAELDRVTWQRFATGLYQPLGLRVVDGHVIVLGRDQLTRLHDLNGNGEADYYETFNQDLEIHGHDHAYATRLEIDSQGNFYFLKSGSGPHGSALLKVAPDGSRLDVVARGFRHPYGMGMGPNDEITVADNEGNWVPSSKIDLIEPGGFYGFLGGHSKAPEELVWDRPLCYIPKIADNSSGGQIWVSSDQWGDYHRGEMLHLSWGRCTLHAVLRERVGHVWQAATVQFPGLAFLSGPGEGRFHPVDGQLYVSGLTGWQTAGSADGSLQRVRYTGRPVTMPEAFHVHENGLRVRFTRPVDPVAAERRSNYRIEQWNYKWSATYGSFHYSIRRPGEIGHDALHVSSARLLSDGRTVFLEVSDLQPVDQIQLHVDVNSLDGHPLRFNVYGTIRALGAPFVTLREMLTNGPALPRSE